jgi:hypothetical protein
MNSFRIRNPIFTVPRLEANLDNRRRQRTDIRLQENCPEVRSGLQTRDLAAQKAGSGNAKTYEQARKDVVDVLSLAQALAQIEHNSAHAAAGHRTIQ